MQCITNLQTFREKSQRLTDELTRWLSVSEVLPVGLQFTYPRHYPTSRVGKLEHASDSPLLKHQLQDPNSSVFQKVGLGWGLRDSIAATAAPWTSP